jgi:hypothetical protein
LNTGTVVAVPTSERQRLIAEYLAPQPTAGAPRVDLIVLTKSHYLAPFSPPAGEFEKVYENSIYRVYLPIHSSQSRSAVAPGGHAPGLPAAGSGAISWTPPSPQARLRS